MSNIKPPVGILLVNIGSPRSTDVADVRTYLRRFLSDPRVIDLPPVARWLLLNLIILPFRPKRSAAAYRKIWTDEGSPLVVHSIALAERLEAELGDGARVRAAMLYGEPEIPTALDTFAHAGIDEILVIPLYPQYASASTGSAIEAVTREATRRWVVPNLHFMPPFYDQPLFIDAVARRSEAHLDAAKADHVLMSFHGVPVSHCTRTDPTGAHCRADEHCCEQINVHNRNCYRAQCFATARALTQRLHLDPEAVTVAFQSRLGKTPWITPFTDHTLVKLAEEGVKKLAVLEPSFVADCLETLEELGIAGRDSFKAAGGEDLTVVPCLNASEIWAQALATLIRQRLPEAPL